MEIANENECMEKAAAAASVANSSNISVNSANPPQPFAPQPMNTPPVNQPDWSHADQTHAIQYVQKVRDRFKDDTEIYRTFLRILHTYQEERAIKNTLEQVSALFADNPDLLMEFEYFLPEPLRDLGRRRFQKAIEKAEQNRRTQYQQDTNEESLTSSLSQLSLSAQETTTSNSASTIHAGATIAESTNSSSSSTSTNLCPEDYSAIISATNESPEALTKLLMNRRVDVNDRGDMGTTPIIHAARNGNLAIMETLFRHGANINHQDDNGETALMWAVRCKQIDMVEQLVTKGADVTLRGYAGTALMLAHEHLQDVIPLLAYHESKAFKKLSKSA